MGMHNLSGAFGHEVGEIKICNEKIFTLIIQFSSKNRNYYSYTSEAWEEWAKKLKQYIGCKSFFDFYDIQTDICEGKFGVVKRGVHKKTKEKVQ
jgi:hypothetical protein